MEIQTQDKCCNEFSTSWWIFIFPVDLSEIERAPNRNANAIHMIRFSFIGLCEFLIWNFFNVRDGNDERVRDRRNTIGIHLSVTRNDNKQTLCRLSIERKINSKWQHEVDTGKFNYNFVVFVCRIGLVWFIWW